MWIYVLCTVALIIKCYPRLIRRCISTAATTTYLGTPPPGCKGLPLIGETLQLIWPSYSSGLHPFIKERVRKYGPIFWTILAGRHVVMSTDPRFNNYIIHQEGRLVELWYMDAFSKLLVLAGKARVNALGAVHKYLRSITLSHFGTESLKQSLLTQIEEMVGRTPNIWSNRMIFKLTTKFMFGYNFAKSIEKIGEKLIKSKPSAFSFPLNIPGTQYHNFLKEQKKMKDSFRNMIKERRNSTGTSDGPGDCLDHAIADMQTEQFLTEKLEVNLMFGVLYASFDTILTGITLIVDFISAHPSVLDELLAEHGAILERREDTRHTLNWDEYRSMKFTNQVINEALRLGNISVRLLRRVLKDIQMDGWAILPVHGTPHFNSDTYKDPLIFNPWRWKELDSFEISKTFRPFGGGTRQCAGAKYAKAVLAVFIHVLVTKYSWTKLRGQVVYNPMVGFGEGVHIKVSDRT